jgi:hypothetical protein
MAPTTNDSTKKVLKNVQNSIFFQFPVKGSFTLCKNCAKLVRFKEQKKRFCIFKTI